MEYNIEKQEKKIKKMELDIKGNYILQTILGLILGLLIKRLLFNNILVVILCIIMALYSAFTYAKKQNEKIDKLKWEIAMYKETKK